MRYAIIGLLLLVAACGGASDSSPTTQPASASTTDQAATASETSTTTTTAGDVTPSTQGDGLDQPEQEDETMPTGDLEPADQAPSTTVPDETTTPGEAPLGAGSFVESAKADLAERLGVAASDIDVVLIEQVTWRSSALGCPQPDRGYLDVLTAGQRAVLSHAGLEYHYHGGESPFLCADPETPLPPSADPNA